MPKKRRNTKKESQAQRQQIALRDRCTHALLHTLLSDRLTNLMIQAAKKKCVHLVPDIFIFTQAIETRHTSRRINPYYHPLHYYSGVSQCHRVVCLFVAALLQAAMQLEAHG
jgi:hypothetical protein